MKKTTITCLAFAILTINLSTFAEDAPQMPTPVKEHEWLQQFVGEWDYDMEITMEPDKPMKAKGTETARMLGGFWLLSSSTGEMMGMSSTSQLTLGFDPDKKKYVGSWIDSMSSVFWKYEGTVDETRKILTLDTEGTCAALKPGTIYKFKEVTEFKSKDHKVFTSSIQGEDGKWTKMVTVNSYRKK